MPLSGSQARGFQIQPTMFWPGQQPGLSTVLVNVSRRFNMRA